jgi:uncharacterized protein (TIGR03083 family)
VIDYAEIYRMTTVNRLMIADVLEGLDDRQWAATTLCPGWTVHHMAAHFVQPMLVGFGRFFVTAVRFRGDTDKTVDHLTRRLARRGRTDLVALLRGHAKDPVNPPRVGPMGPFAETCIHLRDIARPLGVCHDVPIDHWRTLLDYLTSPSAAPALVLPGRLDGLSVAATDTDWSSGAGAAVTGPIEAVAMAVAGRPAAPADLRGPGLQKLAGSLGSR